MTGAIAAPVLGEADIKAELDRINANRSFSASSPFSSASRLVALHGTGERRDVTAGGILFHVVPTRCELELRALLGAREVRDPAGTVFLVDWTPEQLPLDLACRFAGGRMYRVTSETRLASLFGARAVDPALVGTALARVLLAGATNGLGKIPGQVLRRDEAYRRFLATRVGLPAEGLLDLERLLAFCATSRTGPSFASQGVYGEDTWKALRKEVAAFIAESVGREKTGPAAGLVDAAWRAWEAGAGQRLLELCLVVEALLPLRGTYAEGVLKGALPTLAPGWGDALLASSAALGDRKVLDRVLELVDEESDGEAGAASRQIAAGAEALIDDPELRQALEPSTRLPVGYAARRERLASALEALARDPSPPALALIREADAALREHRLDGEQGRGRLEQREMALRLAAYLVHRAGHDATEPPVRGSEHQPALDLAERYAREGGFVDSARRRVRGAGDDSMGRAYRAVLAKVDELRREDDRQFAAGLVRWLEAGRPSAQVLSIAECSKRLVAELLDENDRRKLLVVLVDGMCWADAVELAGSLGDEPDRWAPASWRPKRVDGRSATPLPPVLASLPTLTQVSRAAFFAGKDHPRHGDEPTAQDRQRWIANRPIARTLGEGQDAELLLKDALVAGGELTAKARDLVQRGPRVVAVVLNAIDDQLKGSQQIWLECTVDHIKPLRELLAEAATAERAVLLIADHGHVPGDVLVSRGTRGDGGARWRPLREGEKPEPFEVALPARSTWVPAGAAGVAAVWDETACYGSPRYGEHGGASLAEVVAPALLVVPEALGHLDFDEPDDALRPVSMLEPAWWRLALPERRVDPVPRPPEPAPHEVSRQLGLPEIAPLPAAPEPPLQPRVEPEPVAPPLVGQLRKSPVFKGHVKGLPEAKVETALAHLGALLSAGGRLGTADFARECAVQGYQVTGLVARLGEILNLDGYPVVEHDTAGQQVTVNISMLTQLFEVKT